MTAVQSTPASSRLNMVSRWLSQRWQQAIRPHASIQDPGTRRQVQLLSSFLLALIALLMLSIVTVFALRPETRPTIVSEALLCAVLLIAYGISRTRQYQWATILAVSTLSLIAFVSIYNNPLRATSTVFAYVPLALIVAGFLLPPRITAAFVIVDTVVIFLLPLFVADFPMREAGAIGGITLSIGVLLMIFSAVRNQTERDRLEVLSKTNQELQGLRDTLEQRVKDRTAQLQASAEVGQAAAATLEPNLLLHQAVELITDHFGFYYAAVFTLDSMGTIAVLREASGEAGRILKAREHQLDVNERSMVGYAISQRKARIALDVGADSVHFANPLLPDTRAEIALPLIAGNRVLGALDVQSTQPAAFDESSAVVLQAMADQIAVALNNAEQFKQAEIQARQQTNLNQFSRSLFAASKAEELYRVLATTLKSIVPHDYLSLTFTQINSPTLREYSLKAEADPVLAEGPMWSMASTLSGRACTARQPVVSAHLEQDVVLDDVVQWELAGFRSALCLPLIVGERVLGTLNFANVNPQAYSLENAPQLEQLAGQVAVALENQRLAQAQQKSLQEMEALTRQLTGQAWAKRRQRQTTESVQYARTGIETDLPASTPEMDAAIERRAPIVRSEPDHADNRSPYQAALAVPIVLRGEVLGGLQVSEAGQAREWTEDDLTFTQAVADQVALALDNARLIEEAERRAERERLVADISTRMFAANDLESIVQIAGDELGRVLRVKQTTVRVRADLAAALVPPGSGQTPDQRA